MATPGRQPPPTPGRLLTPGLRLRHLPGSDVMPMSLRWSRATAPGPPGGGTRSWDISFDRWCLELLVHCWVRSCLAVVPPSGSGDAGDSIRTACIESATRMIENRRFVVW